MHIDELLAQLSGIKATGTGKWMALCPAHTDRHPSLSLALGRTGILIKCWAGCSLADITAALGITISMLFFTQRSIVETPGRTNTLPFNWRAIANRLEHHSELLWLRAEEVFALARNLSCASWSGTEVEAALNAVDNALADRERARLLLNVATHIRARGILKDKVVTRHAT